MITRDPSTTGHKRPQPKASHSRPHFGGIYNSLCDSNRMHWILWAIRYSYYHAAGVWIRGALLNRKWYFRCLCLVHSRRKTFIYIMVLCVYVCVCAVSTNMDWSPWTPNCEWTFSMLTAFIWHVSQANIRWVSACFQQWQRLLCVKYACVCVCMCVLGIVATCLRKYGRERGSNKTTDDDTRTM